MLKLHVVVDDGTLVIVCPIDDFLQMDKGVDYEEVLDSFDDVDEAFDFAEWENELRR